MPMIYSPDLRRKALESMDRGFPLQRVSKTLSIAESTLRSWRKKFRETGSYFATRANWGRKPLIQDLDKFQKFVEEKPDRTQAEMAEEWGGVSESTIGRSLQKIGFTYKKNFWVQRKRRT
jgi:transposase